MLSCGGCGSAFRPEDLHLELAIARCSSCGVVSPLSAGPARPSRPVAVRPSTWTEIERPQGVVLSQRWFGLSSIFLLLFTVFWDGALLLGFFSALISDGWMALGFVFVPHTWAGAFMAYLSLAHLLNVTTIDVGPDTVRVSYGPLPWLGARAVARDQVAQLYVEDSSIRVNKQPRWNVAVMSPDGVGSVLIRLVSSLGEARYLEQRIEQALGVVDAPVDGESR